MKTITICGAAISALFLVVLSGCSSGSGTKTSVTAPATPATPATPAKPEFQPGTLPADFKAGDQFKPIEKYEAMKIPDDNPLTPEKVAFGRQLYFDKRLSGDAKLACYSCHVNEKGLTDGLPTAVGAFGKKLTRSAPTMWNIGYHNEWYWDGRAKTLEGQALAAWKLANMGAKDAKEDKISAEVMGRLTAVKEYQDQAKKIFNEELNEKNVAKALAAYMRTIVSRNTPFDRWQRGDQSAVSDAAKRGYEVFKKAKCDNCHTGTLFTSQQYYNVGIGMDKKDFDVGRFKVTNEEKDKGAFKAPTLRDISDSAPYFHDGSVATLEEAVKLMVAGGIQNPHIDKVNLQKADLKDEEVKDLIEFLKSLDEQSKLEEPTIPQ